VTYTEWKDAAKVLDRLFFWIVFLAMTASALIILLVPIYKVDSELPSSESEQI
jgi:nicotinic acetylcholine receptor alpha-9/nicotinic acetylcholine receptor